MLTHAPSCRRFFTLVLLLFLLHSVGLAIFRFQGSLCRNENIASTGGAFLFLVMLLLGGCAEVSEMHVALVPTACMQGTV